MSFSLLAQSAFFTVDEVLSPYVYVFYVAFLLSFIFTPVMQQVATYYNIIDQPDLVRKMHARPVAYLGGVAVFLGWVGGMAMSQLLYMHAAAIGLPEHVVLKGSIIAGAFVVVMLGLWDDVASIKPRTKIAGQVFAAVVMLVEGVGTHVAAPLLDPISARTSQYLGWPAGGYFPEWMIVSISCAMTIAIIVFCCNATNLMDGLDGLCGGVTAIIALGFVILAVHLAQHGGGATVNWDGMRVVLALALLGAVMGFVPFNFNPASIFMGDTGSMFLGFSCATLIILVADAGSKWFLAAMVMFALPVLDTSLAFARRWVNRRPVFSADKHHFHHQLVARGLTVRKAVLVSYGLAIAFVILGVAIVFMRARYAAAAYLVIFGSIVVAAFKMGMVHERPLTLPKPRPLTGTSVTTAGEALTSGSVLEIREDEKKSLL